MAKFDCQIPGIKKEESNEEILEAFAEEKKKFEDEGKIIGKNEESIYLSREPPAKMPWLKKLNDFVETRLPALSNFIERRHLNTEVFKKKYNVDPLTALNSINRSQSFEEQIKMYDRIRMLNKESPEDLLEEYPLVKYFHFVVQKICMKAYADLEGLKIVLGKDNRLDEPHKNLVFERLHRALACFQCVILLMERGLLVKHEKLTIDYLKLELERYKDFFIVIPQRRKVFLSSVSNSLNELNRLENQAECVSKTESERCLLKIGDSPLFKSYYRKYLRLRTRISRLDARRRRLRHQQLNKDTANFELSTSQMPQGYNNAGTGGKPTSDENHVKEDSTSKSEVLPEESSSNLNSNDSESGTTDAALTTEGSFPESINLTCGEISIGDSGTTVEVFEREYSLQPQEYHHIPSLVANNNLDSRTFNLLRRITKTIFSRFGEISISIKPYHNSVKSEELEEAFAQSSTNFQNGTSENDQTNPEAYNEYEKTVDGSAAERVKSEVYSASTKQNELDDRDSTTANKCDSWHPKEGGNFEKMLSFFDSMDVEGLKGRLKTTIRACVAYVFDLELKHSEQVFSVNNHVSPRLTGSKAKPVELPIGGKSPTFNSKSELKSDATPRKQKRNNRKRESRSLF